MVIVWWWRWRVVAVAWDSDGVVVALVVVALRMTATLPTRPHRTTTGRVSRSYHANAKCVEADRHVLSPKRAVVEPGLVRASKRGRATLQCTRGGRVAVAAGARLDRNSIVARGDIVVPGKNKEAESKHCKHRPIICTAPLQGQDRLASPGAGTGQTAAAPNGEAPHVLDHHVL